MTESKPVRYFLREGEDILTDRDLEREFSEHKGDPDLPTTFAEFLELCMTYNNGSLREIPSADMRLVHVLQSRTTEYGVIEEAMYIDRIFRVREIVSNAKEIIDGVFFVAILDDRIVEQKGISNNEEKWTWKGESEK